MHNFFLVDFINFFPFSPYFCPYTPHHLTGNSYLLSQLRCSTTLVAASVEMHPIKRFMELWSTWVPKFFVVKYNSSYISLTLCPSQKTIKFPFQLGFVSMSIFAFASLGVLAHSESQWSHGLFLNKLYVTCYKILLYKLCYRHLLFPRSRYTLLCHYNQTTYLLLCHVSFHLLFLSDLKMLLDICVKHK